MAVTWLKNCDCPGEPVLDLNHSPMLGSLSYPEGWGPDEGAMVCESCGCPACPMPSIEAPVMKPRPFIASGPADDPDA